MKDEELIEMSLDNEIVKPKTSKYTVRGVLMMFAGLGAIWFIGAILTPLFPEEFIFMFIYAVLYYFFGFDPVTIYEKFFKKRQ